MTTTYRYFAPLALAAALLLGCEARSDNSDEFVEFVQRTTSDPNKQQAIFNGQDTERDGATRKSESVREAATRDAGTR